MATKKKAATKSKSGSAKKGSAKPQLFLQTDDPIIVKGGSITIDFDHKFARANHPQSERRRRTHPLASSLTAVIIKHANGTQDRYGLRGDDEVHICYDWVLPSKCI